MWPDLYEKSHGCIARRIRLSGSRWAAHVACTGDGREAAVIGEPKRKESFGSTWRQIGCNIEGIGYGMVAGESL